MDDVAIICLDSEIVLYPSLGGLQQWLPEIDHGLSPSQRFDARHMISQMADVFASQLSYAITSNTIVTILGELIGHLKPNLFAASSVGTRLHRKMEASLRKDLEAANTSDLRRSRHGFLIFCLLARLTRSQALAGSMVGFLRCYVYEIVYGEEPELLREWCMGIVTLQDLVAGHILRELLHCFSRFANRAYKPRLQPAYYDPRAEMIMRLMTEAQHYPLHNHQRGRIPRMLEGPAGYLRDPSLSVGRPRRHLRHHRHLQIAYPWAQPNGHFDKVGKLQYQQEEMNMKLNHIDRKLGYLF